ncbi:MAG TPA: DUF3352 domain-containing protein [Planctomycetaceae bacterium]|nr:DUF3352 domain-containing protein [Planctomycetaceae bacterium]
MPTLVLACGASWAWAQDGDLPSKPLIGLVGRDAGLVMEATRLSDRLPEATRSPILGRLRELELYRRWLASDDYQKLVQTRNQLESLLDTASLSQFVDDVFGESVVVAVYPAGGSEPAGILLTQARSPDVLARTLSAWNAAERADLETLRHSGREYVRRTVPSPPRDSSDDSKTQYYAAIGRTFALSDNEPAVKRALELAASTDLSDSLAEESRYRTARQSLADETLATAWVNPQVWEAAAGETGPGDASSALRAVGLSRGVESVIVGLRLEDGVLVEAVVHLEAAASRDAWSEFVEQAAGPAELLGRAPRNALLVLAGRTDLTRTERLLSAQLPEQNRRQWEMIKQLSPLLAIDLVNDVLPVLGENWALCLVPRDDPQPHAPLDAVFAFDLAAGPDVAGRRPGQERLDRGLATAWERLARILAQADTQPDVAVQTETAGSTVIRWVAGLGPYAPTCAVSDEALVLASSPAAARAWLEVPAGGRLAADAAYGGWHRRYLAGRNPALFVNVAALRDSFSTHRHVLARRAADEGRLSAEAAAERLDRFDDLLKLVDAAFATVELGERHVRIVVGSVVASEDPPHVRP